MPAYEEPLVLPGIPFVYKKQRITGLVGRGEGGSESTVPPRGT